MNTLYKLRIPSTITPRYINDKKQLKSDWLSKISQYIPSFQQNLKYTWTFGLKLRSNNPLTFNNSSTHDLLQTTINPEKTEADFILSETEVPNKDFVFTYSTQNLMSHTLGSTDTNACAAISFIPKYA